MDNKYLVPDNFDDMVMDKIKDISIENGLSPYAICFAVLSGISSVFALGILKPNYFAKVLENLGLYDIIGEYYSKFLVIYENIVGYMDMYKAMALVFVIAGLYFIVKGIRSGVNKNG